MKKILYIASLLIFLCVSIWGYSIYLEYNSVKYKDKYLFISELLRLNLDTNMIINEKYDIIENQTKIKILFEVSEEETKLEFPYNSNYNPMPSSNKYNNLDLIYLQEIGIYKENILYMNIRFSQLEVKHLFSCEQISFQINQYVINFNHKHYVLISANIPYSLILKF